jgi:hypothetical protein
LHRYELVLLYAVPFGVMIPSNTLFVVAETVISVRGFLVVDNGLFYFRPVVKTEQHVRLKIRVKSVYFLINWLLFLVFLNLNLRLLVRHDFLILILVDNMQVLGWLSLLRWALLTVDLLSGAFNRLQVESILSTESNAELG